MADLGRPRDSAVAGPGHPRGPAFAVPGHPRGFELAAPVSPLPKRIGPFTIIERVASFAFTVTYRAEQAALGRTVLLKTLKPSVAPSSPFAAELTREAKILALLDDEGIPKLHDFVRTDDAAYLVIEDAHSVRLDALIALWATKGSSDLEVALAIALAAADILAHVHARGVVHGAVSPSSIQLAAPGRVICTDFQAAEARQKALPARPEAATARDTSDTAGFLAPEQILGDEVTPAADVWALGVVLQLLLTGANPFAGGELREVVARIRTGQAAPLPSGVPTVVARALARCFSKDPRDRFADAGELRAALGAGSPALVRGALTPVISRATSALGLGEVVKTTDASREPPRSSLTDGASLVRPARALALVLTLGLAGQLVIHLLDGRDASEGDGIAESPAPGTARRDAGLVRVVARPWAEVFVDGELVDTTPIGKPIAVTPGRHFVTFRHPTAPDEQRSIKIAAGQSVFLDVTMRVDRGDAGVHTDAGAPPGSP